MAHPLPIGAVSLPNEIQEVLRSKMPEAKLADWALEAIVVEAVRECMISRRKAASLLGLTNYVDREAFFARHGFTNEYTAEMVEEDFISIASLRPTVRENASVAQLLLMVWYI